MEVGSDAHLFSLDAAARRIRTQTVGGGSGRPVVGRNFFCDFFKKWRKN
jgi:hypothetical protein